MNQAMIDKLKSVEMEVTVRFGITDLPLRDVASLGSGSLIELNRTVDEPVELLVNDFPFAKGEVVVVDGYYSVRITEISPPDRHSSVFLLDSLTDTNAAEDWTPADTDGDASESVPKATTTPEPQAQEVVPPKPQPSADQPPKKSPVDDLTDNLDLD